MHCIFNFFSLKIQYSTSESPRTILFTKNARWILLEMESFVEYLMHQKLTHQSNEQKSNSRFSLNWGTSGSEITVAVKKTICPINKISIVDNFVNKRLITSNSVQGKFKTKNNPLQSGYIISFHFLLLFFIQL